MSQTCKIIVKYDEKVFRKKKTERFFRDFPPVFCVSSSNILKRFSLDCERVLPYMIGVSGLIVLLVLLSKFIALVNIILKCFSAFSLRFIFSSSVVLVGSLSCSINKSFSGVSKLKSL